MKKSFLLIVPAVLALTGCSFNVRFINNTSIPAGFEKGSGSLPGGYESVNYSYTSNGSINDEGLSKSSYSHRTSCDRTSKRTERIQTTR